MLIGTLNVERVIFPLRRSSAETTLDAIERNECFPCLSSVHFKHKLNVNVFPVPPGASTMTHLPDWFLSYP